MQKQIMGNATLYCGDVLDVLPALSTRFDAVITDPPYSSGGLHKNERSAQPSAKYLGNHLYAEFSGDNRDQRSWAFWSTRWLSMAARLVHSGGYMMVFSDWRQLPTLTDVFQAGGVVWRGLVVWDKTQSSRAPHTGYFRHQAEYIVWGSIGKLEKCLHAGPFPGVITERVNPSEKIHMTGKPVRVIEELVKPLAPSAHVLDPFMGSGTTALPVLARGGKFTGIELTNQYFDIACDRIEKAQAELTQV
ncbi:DNA-methyltransferase [Yersinia enterocolitica]|nr:site-specific DNA-methyltransferase [Yersinia enterocolitica]